jgi:hypothetical protein
MVEAAHAQPAWVLLAYLAAGVCFILTPEGLRCEGPGGATDVPWSEVPRS